MALNEYLTGPIPTLLGQLTDLESLWLSTLCCLCGDSSQHNTSPLPTPSSDSFDTDDNQFIGTIPSHLSNLRNLYELWLQNDDLIGTLPESIYQQNGATFLYSLRVDGNDIDECPHDVPIVQCSTSRKTP